MENTNRDIVSNKIEEIERLIRDFKEKFEAGTSDADDFMTMHEIERIWAELQNGTKVIYSDLLQDLLNGIDESDLIRKKKRIPTKRRDIANTYQKHAVNGHNSWHSRVQQIFIDPTRS